MKKDSIVYYLDPTASINHYLFLWAVYEGSKWENINKEL